MSDIVKKLLAPVSDEDDYMIGQWPGEPPKEYDVLRIDAAAEIERLRAALREIEGMIPHATPNYTHRVWTIARAALEGKE